MDPEPKPWYSAWPAMLAAGAGTAVIQLVYWRLGRPAWLTDPLFLFMAKAWLARDFHHVLHYHFQPLFPIIIAAFTPLTHSVETAAQVAGLGFACLTAVPVYYLAEKHFNSTVARLTVFFFSFQFFPWPLEGQAEVPLKFFLFCAFALGSAALTRPRPRQVALTGACFGLASLTKIEAQLYFALWIAILALAMIRLALPWRRFAGRLAWAGGAYLLVMSPYLVAYYHETGRISLNPKTAPLLYIYNEPDWVEACYGLRSDEHGYYTVYDRVLGQGYRRPLSLNILSYCRSNLGRIAPAYRSRLVFSFTDMVPAYLWMLLPISGLSAGLVILAGLARPGWTRAQARKELYLLSIVFLALSVVPLFGPNLRFFSPIGPILTIFFSRGVEQLSLRLLAGARLVSGASAAARARIPLLVVLAALAAAPNLLLLARSPREAKFDQMLEDERVPATWIHDHLPPGRRIMSSWMEVDFWYLAGLNPEDDIFVPKAAPEELIAYARQENVEYLLVENGGFLLRYPELRPLLEPGFTHPAPKREYEYLSPRGRYYVIYRILPPAPA